ncbi:plasmid mobilization protein [Chitinophaga nivalis]|uniref:Plasmid mobilization relaxosome protein MobC n=1 Tax=Chitinophaga nivalis TaxID=2991709 RepID=A0ABT3IN72_9BACT|nr:hypothetical protein [Chitinophaga nivalis]MCW3464904.1 hypothetical protein [Chitinophaga nivalis]MCW3485405.1 hypothetical protein [Chitinophaga nivalis]
MEQTEEKRKGKGGRPPKAVRKEIRTGVRFTKAEYFIVKEKAIKARMHYTGYIRQMALFGSVTAHLTRNRRISNNLANNINQVSNSGISANFCRSNTKRFEFCSIRFTTRISKEIKAA